MYTGKDTELLQREKKTGFGKKGELAGRERGKKVYPGMGLSGESFRSLEEVGLEAALMNCFVGHRDGEGKRGERDSKKYCSVL